MATATTVGKSRESSIGSAAIMVTMISMLGKSCASVGAIRKVRFEEKPDSIYRAVSCICPDWSVSWSVSSSGGTLCRDKRRLIGPPIIVIARRSQKNRD